MLAEFEQRHDGYNQIAIKNVTKERFLVLVYTGMISGQERPMERNEVNVDRKVVLEKAILL